MPDDIIKITVRFDRLTYEALKAKAELFGDSINAAIVASVRSDVAPIAFLMAQKEVEGDGGDGTT